MIPIVSIIVAAHSMEGSIKQCLHSLQNQSLQAIEVLIVNHAFTDETVRLCEEFVKEDDRFRLIASDQPGLSEARNDGIKEAKGKYIAFVDGNDFVEYKMYEKLVERAEQKYADFVLCGYTKYWPETNRKKHYKINEALLSKTNPVDYFLAKHNEAYTVAWNKLFLRKIIHDEKLYFENRTFFEDVGFVARYLSFAKKIAIVNEPQYNFVQSEGRPAKIYNPSIAQSHEQTYAQLKQFFDKRQYRNVIEALNLRLYIHRYHYVLLTTSNTRQLKSLERQIIRESKNFSQLPWKHRMMKPLVKLRVYPTFFRLVRKVKA
ncbi:glycosyltransferase family 2 protein [Solibacillus sp. FSL W8-0474]|uniref:glycosyltransferase family 2 protein n=1 Tax=Solibacillus sp. FSL W8-0474 TaxID=2975336 RepID=UPI0030F55823